MTRIQKEVPLASASGEAPPSKMINGKEVVYEQDGTAWTIRKDPLAPFGVGDQPIAFATAIRTQNDRDSDLVSAQTALHTGSETDVRIEYGDDTNINNIMRTYGIDNVGRPIEFREIDYTMDLQQAYMAIDEAKKAVHTVPEELRNQYPTWQAVLNGAENGQYAKDLQALDEKKQRAKEAADAAKAAGEKPPAATETPKEAPKT